MSSYLVSFSEALSNPHISISSQGSYTLALQLDGGAEPEYYADEEVAVVFDGELFNELSYGLERGSSASQIIAALYRKDGEHAFKQLHGVYFLILWDKRAGILYGVRDQTGVYPFFFSIVDSSLHASTCIDLLARSSRSGIDRLQLAQHLADRWIDPSRTYYSSVNRLPSGNILKFKSGRTERYRYWCPTDEKLSPARPEEYTLFPEILERAVSRAIGNADFGILMSGGIDSVTISTIASRVRLVGQNEHALSLKYPHAFIDESRVQQSVSASLCINLELVDNYSAIAPLTPVDAYLNLSSDWPVPLQNFWFPAYYALAQRGKLLGCRSILTGDGGDEYLDDGPVIAAELLKKFDLIGLYRLWQVASGYHLISKFEALKLLLWKFGLRPILSDLARASIYRLAPNLWREKAKRAVSESLPDWMLPDNTLRDELIEGCIQHSRLSNELYKRLGFHNGYVVIFQDNPLTSLYTEQLFEMGRRLGVRVRSPFMDSELVDLLIRTPVNVLNRGGKSKALAREILEKAFPELEFSQQRKVLLDPIGHKSIADYYKSAKELKFTRLTDLGIIDSRRLNLTQTLPPPVNRYYLKELLNLEVWLSGKF